MNTAPSPKLAKIVGSAFQGGVETSLAELSDALALKEDGVLNSAQRVADFVVSYNLELSPPLERGDFTSPRVLRNPRSDTGLESQVQELIAKGEGPTVEFKESMVASMHHWHKKGELFEIPSLPGELVKSIGAFLNSDGGDLLVGISDSGHPEVGIEIDLQLKNWNLDKWQLRFENLVRDSFYNSGEVLPHIQQSMLEVEGHPVFRVNVVRRSEPSFAKRSKGDAFEYFVRSGPSTLSLNMPDFYADLKSRT